jgi:predicted metalloprotease
MSQVSRRAVVAAAVGGVLLSGCTTSIDGTSTPPVSDVSADQFPITGATDSDVDRLARNALADLNDFWSEAYPEFFGEDFTPLQGGYWSVDTEDLDYDLYPEDTGVGCDELPIDPAEVEGNAFYQQDCDVVVYDAALLRQLTEETGSFSGPAVMAHEFGHAMQGRFGFSEVTIRDETQADCFAGAFTRWVADGNAEHTTLRIQDLDDVLVAFIQLRDPVGETDTDVEGAHGSGFDRASGFYEGYSGGVGSCRDDFGADRVFTVGEFTDDNSAPGSDGNASYDDIQTIIDDSLPVFYEGDWLDGFDQPSIELFDGTAPGCGDMGAEDRDVGFCADDNTVYVDEADLLQPAYDEIGDFAVATAIALPYAEAARASLGLSTDDDESTVSSVCLTGSYTAAFFNGDFGPSLSPGDVDEAILFLLTYGQTDSVLPNTTATGFELVGAFRAGFLQGAGAQECGIAG